MVIDLAKNRIRSGLFMVFCEGVQRFRWLRGSKDAPDSVVFESRDIGDPTFPMKKKDVRANDVLVGEICAWTSSRTALRNEDLPAGFR